MLAIRTLAGARVWVWTRLVRRGGRISATALHAAWQWAPGLLDDALRSLRADGMTHCVSGVWWIRTWSQPNELPPF